MLGDLCHDELCVEICFQAIKWSFARGCSKLMRKQNSPVNHKFMGFLFCDF